MFGWKAQPVQNIPVFIPDPAYKFGSACFNGPYTHSVSPPIAGHRQLRQAELICRPPVKETASLHVRQMQQYPQIQA
ncbi:hypothetical protein D3C86_1803840 [compost metagenome]